MEDNKLYTSFYVENTSSIEINTTDRLAMIKSIIIDVDGTMTDGGIYYDDNGNEMKKFNTKDAAGFFTAKACGIQTVIITGRSSFATERRMKELHASVVEQGIVNKVEYIQQYMEKNHIQKKELAYIGDDLNDYSGMKLAGFVACPADAAWEIIQIADYVSEKNGGEGVVRDVITHILKKRGQWEQAIQQCYKMGR
jgi:3-deoxy-D-manno-octulosonate 8-phosphate phosphatase (KDO 8-P phosphatase)